LTLVDSNVLRLDLLTSETRSWGDVVDFGDRDRDCYSGWRLMINDIVYAELSVGFVPTQIEMLDRFVADVQIWRLRQCRKSGAIPGGKTHARYRQIGRHYRTGVLPDFFIGAQAAVLNLQLLDP
jgi:hypothetical protein